MQPIDRFTRLYSDGDQSRFELREIQGGTEEETVGTLSRALQGNVGNLVFNRADEGYDHEHGAPCSQLVIVTGGDDLVIDASGDERIFHPGEILLAEDTESTHRSWAKNGENMSVLFVTLSQETRDQLLEISVPIEEA